MAKEKLAIHDLMAYKCRELNWALGLPVTHPTSVGDNSELRWIRFFGSFLPTRYAASKGFVFDSRGAVSDQIDCIVYDPMYSSLVHETENGEKYMLAESVYAVFEVKQDGKKSHFTYAEEKIASVRQLHRTSAPTIASGIVQPPREQPQLIGGLLCTQGPRPEKGLRAAHERERP